MEITLSLESYDDIFDDFDMQHYIERAISADFVNVLSSRIKNIDAKERITLDFIMPKQKRIRHTEDIVEKRLKGYFANMAKYWKDKETETINQAILILTLGLLFFIIGQMLIHRFVPFFDEYLIIPAWILTFYGLDRFFTEKPKITSKRQFYETIEKAKMTFRDADIYSR